MTRRGGLCVLASMLLAWVWSGPAQAGVANVRRLDLMEVTTSLIPPADGGEPLAEPTFANFAGVGAFEKNLTRSIPEGDLFPPASADVFQESVLTLSGRAEGLSARASVKMVADFGPTDDDAAFRSTASASSTFLLEFDVTADGGPLPYQLGGSTAGTGGSILVEFRNLTTGLVFGRLGENGPFASAGTLAPGSYSLRINGETGDFYGPGSQQLDLSLTVGPPEPTNPIPLPSAVWLAAVTAPLAFGWRWVCRR